MSNFSDAMDDARQFTENLCSIIESLEAEVARLEGRVARLDKQAAWLDEQREYLAERAGGLEAERDQLKAEIAELRAGQGRWPKPDDDFPCCSSQPTGYADDDHQDAEARQDGHVKPVDTTPATCKEKGEHFTRPTGLTVHALNVAPVGSYLSRGMGSNGRRKADDGLWEKAWLFPGQHPDTSEELIANGWADATLRLPEDQR